MRTRRFSLAIVFASSLLPIVGYGPLSPPRSGVAADAAEGNPFHGKALLVFLDSRSSIPLEKAQVRKLGDASFLVGKGSEDLQGHHWAKNRTVWLPMSRVEMITEFDNTDEMKKAWKEAMENILVDPPVEPNPKEKAPPPQKKN